MELLPYQINKGFILAVSAPSGTGKTSLCDRLAADFPFVYRSISATTRPKRSGEDDGIDYQFVSSDDFKKRIEQGYFLETAEVFGNWYGTPRRPVEEALESAKVIVMDIDIVGALRIKELKPLDTVLLFIVPPTLADLEKRLRARGKNSAEDLEKRLKMAADEIRESKVYDYIICNRDFDEAYHDLRSIVMAERFRSNRLRPLLPA